MAALARAEDKARAREARQYEDDDDENENDLASPSPPSPPPPPPLRIPKYAHTHAWPCVEYYGAVCFYFDAEDRDPPYSLEPVPEIDERLFVFRGRHSETVRMHIQDFAENAADFARFRWQRRRFALNVPLLGRCLSVVHRLAWQPDALHAHVAHFTDAAHVRVLDRWPVPRSEVSLRIAFVGPGGLVHYRFSTYWGDIVLFQSFTPLAPLRQSVDFCWFADPAVPRLMVTYVMSNMLLAFRDDARLWQTKTYARRPLLLETDGPVAAVRLWFRRFYSVSTRTAREAGEEFGGDGEGMGLSATMVTPL